MELARSSTVNLDDINPLKVGNVNERREYYRTKTKNLHWDNVKDDFETSSADKSIIPLIYNPADFDICK